MTTYHRPRTRDDALALLAGGGMTVAAGCTDLYPATKAKALGGPVLDITAVAGLRGIARQGDGLRIGATTTWTDVLRAELPPALDMLKAAAREVGSAQIQNAGTIAGNLCNASPAADGVPCLLALDAAVELAREGGTRVLPLAEFLTGPRRTALAPGELVTAITLPAAALEGESRFLKLGARTYLVISIAMVAARVVVREGRIASAALSVGACGPVATRLGAVERALARLPLAEAPSAVDTDAVAAALLPIDDVRSDAGYRAEAAAELLRRALADLAAPEARAA